MIFLAPAKINLTLQITGRDPKDGYHFIESVFDPVSLYDILDIEPSQGGGISVKDVLSRLKIKQENNLVYRAAKLLQKASGTRQGACITLYKHIPYGAGLGGGSSDAAAVLKGLNRLWGLKFSKNKLKKLAFILGSDVPFFIDPRPANVHGKGNIIKPFKRPAVLWYVIVVKKGVKVSTPDAYNWYDIDNKLTLSQNPDILVPRLMREPKIPLSAISLYNDFEAPVYKRLKILRKVRDTLLKCGNAAGACMSGSGAAVFALFMKKKNAQACFRKMKKVFKGSFICLAHSL